MRHALVHLHRHRRPLLLLMVVTLLTFGFGGPARAEDEKPTPGSCQLHPVHIVNPGCLPALTSEATEPVVAYPNVSPDVQNVSIARPFVLTPEGTFVPGELQVQFDGWVRNLGDTPLELMADDPNNPSTVMQCVAWTANRACREKRVVGDYVWHEEHRHFHFADFATYQLRRLGSDGRPDYSEAGLLAVSEKVSYCLVDSSLLDVTDPSPPFYITCGPNLQGVSPGWADVYSIGTPGQELLIEGLADGRYALIVALDASGRVYETDDTDNVVEITVEFSGGMTEATIVGRHYP